MLLFAEDGCIDRMRVFCVFLFLGTKQMLHPIICKCFNFYFKKFIELFIPYLVIGHILFWSVHNQCGISLYLEGCHVFFH